MSDDPELDLVVVGDEEAATVGRDEAPPEPPALLAADGNVVQVGLVGRQAPGAGHRLVERGMDALVRSHLGQERLAVGRAQLLHLPVAQQGVDDGVLAPQLLQGLGVGRVARLGLLLRCQAQLA
jgi:hypothetical protein